MWQQKQQEEREHSGQGRAGGGLKLLPDLESSERVFGLDSPCGSLPI